MRTKDNYSWYVISMCRLYARYIEQRKPLREFSRLEILDIQSVEKALIRLNREPYINITAAVKEIYFKNPYSTLGIREITQREHRYCADNNLELREFNKLLAKARRIIAEERGLRIEG